MPCTVLVLVLVNVNVNVLEDVSQVLIDLPAYMKTGSTSPSSSLAHENSFSFTSTSTCTFTCTADHISPSRGNTKPGPQGQDPSFRVRQVVYDRQ